MSLNLDLIYSEFNLNVASDSDRIVYLFEEYRLDASRRMLYRVEEEIALPPKAIETLIALIDRRGEIVGSPVSGELDPFFLIITSNPIPDLSTLSRKPKQLKTSTKRPPTITPQ